MKYKSVISHGVAAWLVAGLDLRAADPASQDPTLHQLFTTALESCDEEYQKIRTTIIAHEKASAFLVEQAQSTNLMVRAIGRAMLLDGLADESWIVREDANKKLMELTGQDLGGKTEAYRLVIETNGIFEVLPHLNAYIDVARRELESERIMFEMSSVRYTITRDEVVVTVSPPGYVTSATYIVPIDRETRKAKGHRWK